MKENTMKEKILKRIKNLEDGLENDEYTKGDFQLQLTIAAIITELSNLLKD